MVLGDLLPGRGLVGTYATGSSRDHLQLRDLDLHAHGVAVGRRLNHRRQQHWRAAAPKEPRAMTCSTCSYLFSWSSSPCKELPSGLDRRCHGCRDVPGRCLHVCLFVAQVDLLGPDPTDLGPTHLLAPYLRRRSAWHRSRLAQRSVSFSIDSRCSSFLGYFMLLYWLGFVY